MLCVLVIPQIGNAHDWSNLQVFANMDEFLERFAIQFSEKGAVGVKGCSKNSSILANTGLSKLPFGSPIPHSQTRAHSFSLDIFQFFHNIPSLGFMLCSHMIDQICTFCGVPTSTLTIKCPVPHCSSLNITIHPTHAFQSCVLSVFLAFPYLHLSNIKCCLKYDPPI